MRTAVFICIGLLGFWIPWWFALGLVFLYIALYGVDHWLLVLGVCWDMTLGARTGFVSVPLVYTVAISCLLLLFALMRPHMRT